MEKNIHFRTVVEIIGKPIEHVEKAINNYIEKLKENSKYEVIKEEIAEIKKQDDQELWATFAELEIKTEKIEDITDFCFNYMPAIIDIISPKEIAFDDTVPTINVPINCSFTPFSGFSN